MNLGMFAAMLRPTGPTRTMLDVDRDRSLI
jgi:hypothetical protein